MQEDIRVLVVDDEELIRSGLTMILNTAPDLCVVAAVAGEAALTAITEHRPDVVLLDITMPHVDGLTILRRLQEWPSPPHVAMLTTFDTDAYLGEALALGAGGFLLKDTAPDQLIRSVRAVATGAGCLSASVVARLRHADGGPAARAADAVHGTSGAALLEATDAVLVLDTLSPRERDILGFVGSGMTNQEIAARLHLAAATVKDHLSAVFTKLDVANRVQAAVLAERAGLVGDLGDVGKYG
ncbi:response regulator [Streptomyces natalensis]|uniref:LuxR family transcriptional regulator n=1 Tax=Streptomyces natalensis ATCC 27448 TaxID=1240678 RepID=A0A0D7CV16_9ACTN|nr:response regulator transcription factor [Streptomyces natalensis]KIZ19207.1 hypothetical protein SNA_01270 [Streptomyces natalensis ATCC 27448]